jgi:glutamate racemase
MIEKSLDQAEKQAQQHLYNLLQHDIDTVILGCTHYGWIENALKSMKTDITIVRSDNHVIDMKNKISLHKGVTNNIRYYASGSISFTYTRHDHQIIKFYSAS